MKTSLWIVQVAAALPFLLCCSSRRDASDSSDPRGTEGDQQAVQEWWKAGPQEDDPAASGAATDATAVTCDWPDPFYHYFACPGACHWALGHTGDVVAAKDGHVSKLASGYRVTDTRVTTFVPEKLLTHVKPFVDGAREVTAAPEGPFEVEEMIQGFTDLYSLAEPPAYLGTDWRRRWVVPESARLPANARVVVGFKPADNAVAPARQVVVAVIPVTLAGEVDFSVFAGTGVTEAAGWDLTLPTKPISVDEAEQLFPRILDAAGVRCAPLRPDADVGEVPAAR